MKEIELGTTFITPDIFLDFIENIKPRFRMQDYNLLNHNCNNFTNEVSQFLLGKGIPAGEKKKFFFNIFFKLKVFFSFGKRSWSFLREHSPLQ